MLIARVRVTVNGPRPLIDLGPLIRHWESLDWTVTLHRDVITGDGVSWDEWRAT